MKSLRFVAIVVVGLISQIGSGGCSPHFDDVESGSYIQLGGDAGSVCVPYTQSDGLDANFGYDVIDNQTQSDVVLDFVELVGAKRIKLVDAFVLPIQMGTDSQFTAVGAGVSWPPGGFQTEDIPDPTLYSLHGYDLRNVRDQTSDHGYNVVLHLKMTGRQPAFDGFELYYTVNGKQYKQKNSLSFRLELESCS